MEKSQQKMLLNSVIAFFVSAALTWLGVTALRSGIPLFQKVLVGCAALAAWGFCAKFTHHLLTLKGYKGIVLTAAVMPGIGLFIASILPDYVEPVKAAPKPQRILSPKEKKLNVCMAEAAVMAAISVVLAGVALWVLTGQTQHPFVAAVCIILGIAFYGLSGEMANQLLVRKGYDGFVLTAGFVWLIGVFIACLLPDTTSGKRIRATGGMIESTTPISRLFTALIVLAVCALCFCCLVPLWHVLMVSLSDGFSALSHEGLAWLPIGHLNFGGYSYVFKDNSIMQSYLNTLIYVVGATAMCMFIDITCGYSLHCKTKAKGFMSILVLLTAMFSGGMIPTYMVIRKLGMVGTIWSLIIPGCTNAYFIMMMMRAFDSVPQATIEAARIDGASEVVLLMRIMLPQTLNMASVIVLNSVVLQWNSWFNANLYVPNVRELWPLQLWIKDIVATNSTFLQTSNPDYNRYLLQYALIVAATLPILAAFPFFIKKMEKAVVAGAVKE